MRISTSVSGHHLYKMNNGGILISIEDTGEGIPPEIKEKIFDPFFTTRHNGTGLGLYNCHKIIEAHNGAIFIEDAPGGGTRVNILLPAGAGNEEITGV